MRLVLAVQEIHQHLSDLRAGGVALRNKDIAARAAAGSRLRHRARAVGVLHVFCAAVEQEPRRTNGDFILNILLQMAPENNRPCVNGKESARTGTDPENFDEKGWTVYIREGDTVTELTPIGFGACSGIELVAFLWMASTVRCGSGSVRRHRGGGEK